MRVAGNLWRKKRSWAEWSRILEEGKRRPFSNTTTAFEEAKVPEGNPKKNGENAPYRHPKQVIYDGIKKSSSKYEEFIGLTDVQEAQGKVKRAEAVFLAARARERQVLRDMVETREKLKDVRERLSHVDYSNTMYLQLASDQHELVNEEARSLS